MLSRLLLQRAHTPAVYYFKFSELMVTGKNLGKVGFHLSGNH
jgi:hypothetical protein